MSAAGFSRGDIDAVVDMVKSMSSWDVDADGNFIGDPTDGTDMAVGIAKQWYKCTWVSQGGIPEVMRTDLGSMAGTPMADLLFTLSISRVLSILRKALAVDGLDSSFAVNGAVHNVFDTSFVDICAIPVVNCAAVLVNKMIEVARVSHRVFLCFNLELNFKPGKSEGVINLCGPGKKKANVMLAKSGGMSSFVAKSGIVISFRFVRSYEHLGTHWPHMGDEISKRCSMMRSGSRRLRSKILVNTGINMTKRLLILQMYIVTKGSFQCCTWAEVPASAFKKFHSCIMNLYRDVSGHYYAMCLAITTGIFMERPSSMISICCMSLT